MKNSNVPNIYCPKCGSTLVRSDPIESKHFPNKTYSCLLCGHFFSDQTKQEQSITLNKTTNRFKKDALDYVNIYKSLDAKSKKYRRSKSTEFRRVRKGASEMPRWWQVAKFRLEEGKLTDIGFAIDTTWMGRINGVKSKFVEIVGLPSGRPIVWKMILNEQMYTIEQILQQLKNLGFNPKVVVIDGAGHLLAAVKKIFPDAVVQLCTIHLHRNLNTRLLPTIKNAKRIGKKKLRLYRKVNAMNYYAAMAENKEQREQTLEDIEKLKLKSKPKRVFEKFKKDLKRNLYHVLTGPVFSQYGELFRNTNVAEVNIRQITDLRDNAKGFKEFESAQNLINTLLLPFALDPEEIRKIKRMKKQPDFEPVYDFEIPLRLYCYELTDLKVLSRTYQIPIQILEKQAEQLHNINRNGFSITPVAGLSIEEKFKKILHKSVLRAQEAKGAYTGGSSAFNSANAQEHYNHFFDAFIKSKISEQLPEKYGNRRRSEFLTPMEKSLDKIMTEMLSSMQRVVRKYGGNSINSYSTALSFLRFSTGIRLKKYFDLSQKENNALCKNRNDNELIRKAQERLLRKERIGNLLLQNNGSTAIINSANTAKAKRLMYMVGMDYSIRALVG